MKVHVLGVNHPIMITGWLLTLSVSPAMAAQGPFDTWRAFSVGHAAGSASLPPVEPAAGLHPGAAFLGDLNGDGRPDLTVVSWFQAPTTITLPEGQRRIRLADLDDVTGAGVPDAVVLGTIASEGSRYGFSVLRGAANGSIGVPECGPAALNAPGRRGVISATGFPTLLANNVVLRAEGLTELAFGYFIASRDAGLVVMPGGSAGTLCLGGTNGRAVGGVIANTGVSGTMSASVDAFSMPGPTGTVAVAPGETWRFQCWFRDTSSTGSTTSNFTDPVAIRFE